MSSEQAMKTLGYMLRNLSSFFSFSGIFISQNIMLISRAII